MAHLRKNITKLYIFSAFEWMLFFIPTIYLFYQSIGLTTQDLFIAQSIFSCVIAVLDFPTGYIADYLGRKKTLITASLFGILGVLVYSQAQNFWNVVTAEVLLGICASLRSGVKEAILYDSLLLLKEEDQFRKYHGIGGSVGQISEGVTSIAGGLLAAIAIRLPFYAQLIAVIGGLLVGLTFKEPEREKLSTDHLANFKRAFHQIWWKDRRVFWSTMLGGIIFTATFASVWFAQTYFGNVGLAVAFFGIVWALGNFAAAAGSYLSHHAQKILTETQQYLIIMGLVIASLLSMAFISVTIGVIFTIIIRFAWGLLSPLSQEVVNRLVPSDLRVSILSIKSLVQRIMFIILGPIYGWITNAYSLSSAMMVASGMLIVFGGLMLFKARQSGALSV